MEITGWPVGVVVRGRTVMREDEVLGRPTGKLVRFG
jgi:dihydroorotase